MKKVSILIPVYKGAKTLLKCLNSCINQTYRNIEIVVVIDGSPDNSFDVAKSVQASDSRVLIINKQNEGLPKTRQVAFSNSTGEYIYHLDQDDYLELNAIEVMVKEIEKNNSDVLVCSCVYEDVNNKFITNWINLITSNSKEILLNNVFTGGLQHNIWGKLIKKNIYKNVKLIENHTGGEDFLATIMMICYNEKISITSIPDILHHYLVHEESLTQTMPAKDFFLFTNEIEKILLETNNENTVLENWSYFRLIKCWRYYLRLGGHDALKNKEYVSQLYKKHYSYISNKLTFFENIELNLYRINPKIGYLFSRIYCKILRHFKAKHK